MPIVRDIKVKIPREDVLRLLKYNKEFAILDQKIGDFIDRLVEEGKRLAEPKAIYRDFWVKGSKEHAIILEGANFDLLGKNIAHHLWKAEGVTLFLVTIGPKLEKRIQEFTKDGSMSNAAILDTVGSVAVESAVNYVNELITTNARKSGYKTIKRFSPGYGDWQLKEQKGLFKVLNAKQAGVALSGGYQMQPQKSVSGVIGWVK